MERPFKPRRFLPSTSQAGVMRHSQAARPCGEDEQAEACAGGGDGPHQCWLEMATCSISELHPLAS